MEIIRSAKAFVITNFGGGISLQPGALMLGSIFFEHI